MRAPRFEPKQTRWTRKNDCQPKTTPINVGIMLSFDMFVPPMKFETDTRSVKVQYSQSWFSQKWLVA